MLRGHPDSGEMWEEIAGSLGGDCRCLAPDAHDFGGPFAFALAVQASGFRAPHSRDQHLILQRLQMAFLGAGLADASPRRVVDGGNESADVFSGTEARIRQPDHR
jgi:hypothetical protein